MLKKLAWAISFFISLLLITQLVLVIYKTNNSYQPTVDQLATAADVNYFLKQHVPQSDALVYRPTGLFIESLRFVDSNTVNISGYIWQKYANKDLPILDSGFIFPEAVKFKEIKTYESKSNEITTIGWYFEGDFIQNFNYSKYPLDHKTIWLRIWSKGFHRNTIITPDLASYNSTNPLSKFGLDPEITLPSYSVKETFFSYKIPDYDTNWGVTNIYQKSFPELYFNIVLKRNVINALISDLLPITIVLFFSFAALLSVSAVEEERKRLGFNLSNILRVSSVFLFVILLAHIRLRETIAVGNVIYIEYIYFIVYLALLYVVITDLLVMKVSKNNRYLKFLVYDSGFWMKVVYFPLVFVLILWVTDWILR